MAKAKNTEAAQTAEVVEAAQTAEVVEAAQTAEVVEAAQTASFAVVCTIPNFYIGNHLIVDVVPKEVLEDERLNKILLNALRTGVIKKA